MTRVQAKINNEPDDVEIAGLTDRELIHATRRGDPEAFGILWQRHHLSATRFARSLTASPIDADELVSEAFYRVLRLIRSNQAPIETFRPYLHSTIRRINIDRARSGYHNRVQLTGDRPDIEPDPADSAEQVHLDDAELATARRAWSSLGPDSRTLLWQLIVEEEPATRVAHQLGITPGAVYQRSARAKEHLRAAFLQQSLTSVADRECVATRRRLGAWARHGLSPRRRELVDSHLATCPHCQAAATAVRDLNHTLRGMLTPNSLGVAAVGLTGSPLLRLLRAGWRVALHQVSTHGMAAGLVATMTAVGVVGITVTEGTPAPFTHHGSAHRPAPVDAASGLRRPVAAAEIGSGPPALVPVQRAPQPVLPATGAVPVPVPAEPSAPPSTSGHRSPEPRPRPSLARPGAASTPSATSHTSAAPPAPTYLAHDLMGRTVPSGLGQAATGGGYATQGPAQFSVSSGAAHISDLGPATGASVVLPAVSATTVRLQLQLTLPQLPSTGGGYYISALLRDQGNMSAAYLAKVNVRPDGAIWLSVSRVDGAETFIGPNPIKLGFAVAAGQPFFLEGQISGGSGPPQLAARAWPASQPEAPAWQLRYTDTTAGALSGPGAVGLFAYCSASTPGAEINLDSLVAQQVAG